MKKSPLLAFLCIFPHLFGQATGATAVNTVQAAESNGWQNWAFTACSAVTATAAVIIVALDNGKSASSH